MRLDRLNGRPFLILFTISREGSRFCCWRGGIEVLLLAGRDRGSLSAVRDRGFTVGREGSSFYCWFRRIEAWVSAQHGNDAIEDGYGDDQDADKRLVCVLHIQLIFEGRELFYILTMHGRQLVCHAKRRVLHFLGKGTLRVVTMRSMPGWSSRKSRRSP